MKIYEVIITNGKLKKGYLLKEEQIQNLSELLSEGVIKEFKGELLFDTSDKCEFTKS